MTHKTLNCKRFSAGVEFSPEDKAFHGKVSGISD